MTSVRVVYAALLREGQRVVQPVDRLQTFFC